MASDLQVVFFASYPICCRAQILPSKIILQRSPGGHKAFSGAKEPASSAMQWGMHTMMRSDTQRQVMISTWCQLSKKHTHGRPLCSAWHANVLLQSSSIGEVTFFNIKFSLRLIYLHLFQSLQEKTESYKARKLKVSLPMFISQPENSS